MTSTAPMESSSTGLPFELPPVRALRHRAEIPMLVLGAGVLVVGALVVVVMLVDGFSAPDWLRTAVVLALVVPVLGSLVLARYAYWSTISNAVEVTADQLPRLHALFVEQAALLGMTPDGEGMARTPRLYLVNGNGVMNAYATKCRLRRGYVVIYSDLLDLAYEYDRFDLMRFVLSHELGHHHCGHTRFRRQMLVPLLRLLQLQQSLSRAQEYTADRVGALLAPAAMTELIGLYAGKHMSKDVDLDAYFGLGGGPPRRAVAEDRQLPRGPPGRLPPDDDPEAHGDRGLGRARQVPLDPPHRADGARQALRSDGPHPSSSATPSDTGSAATVVTKMVSRAMSSPIR